MLDFAALWRRFHAPAIAAVTRGVGSARSADLGRDLQLAHLDVASRRSTCSRSTLPAPKCWVDSAPQATAKAQAVLGRAAVVARGHEAGQEGVAGADRRDRLERLGRDLEEAALGALASTAATQPLGRVMIASPAPSSISSASPCGEVVAVVELVADQLLGLALVRGDHRGPARRPASSGSPSVSSTTVTPRRVQVADEAGVEVGVDAGRQAARRSRRCAAPRAR